MHPRPTRWVSRIAVEIIHAGQIASVGGRSGLRDEGALEASARPRNKAVYGVNPDIATLGAAYAFGITRNHPFIDGNKRVALLTMVAFLGLNGYDFEAEETDVVTRMLELAAGRMIELRLASWVRDHAVRRRSRSAK